MADIFGEEGGISCLVHLSKKIMGWFREEHNDMDYEMKHTPFHRIRK